MDVKATTASAQRLAALLLAGEQLPEEEHRSTFAALYANPAAPSHTDAITLASLPLWPAAHHAASRFYAGDHRAGSSDNNDSSNTSGPDDVVQLATALSLLPRVGDPRTFVTEARSAVAAVKTHVQHFEALVALLHRPFLPRAVLAAHTPQPVAVPAGRASQSLPSLQQDFWHLAAATNSAVALTDALRVHGSGGEALALKRLVQQARRVLAGSAASSHPAESAGAAEPQAPPTAAAADSLRLAPIPGTLFSVGTLRHIVGTLFAALQSTGAFSAEVAREQLDGLAASVRESSWAQQLTPLLRHFALLATAAVGLLRATGETPTIDAAVLRCVQRPGPPTAADGGALLVDAVGSAIVGKQAAGIGNAAAHDAVRDALRQIAERAVGADDEASDSTAAKPLWQQAQERVDEALRGIAADVDFGGESARARDLDALTRITRDVLFAPARKVAANGPFTRALVERILFDRRHGGSDHVGAKRRREAAEADNAPDPRALTPLVPSLSTMFGNSHGDGERRLVTLERIAAESVKHTS